MGADVPSGEVAELCDERLEQAASTAVPELIDDPEAIEAAEAAVDELNGTPELGSAYVSELEDQLIVSWQLTSNGFDEGSSFSVMLAADSYEVLGTTQTKIETIDENSVQLTTWEDGELQSEDVVEHAGETQRSSSPSTVDCIVTATGFAPATALAIVSACSAGCAVTAGAACAICVGAFTALRSASIMTCFGEAS